jgi:anthranilate/para-aminobenzoate synthase component I
VPSMEHEETRNKARAMAQALEVARSREMWL